MKKALINLLGLLNITIPTNKANNRDTQGNPINTLNIKTEPITTYTVYPNDNESRDVSPEGYHQWAKEMNVAVLHSRYIVGEENIILNKAKLVLEPVEKAFS